jgi:hypothetical protein
VSVPGWTLALAILGASLLAGCAGQQQPVTGAPASATRYGAPPEPMGGRWQLAAPGQSQCVMNFAGTGEGEGTIAPEGGCPGNFYTSRKWTFEQGSLVIRDHTGAPLGQLALAAPGRFDGKATNGQPVMLSR